MTYPALGFIRSLGSDVQKDLILFTDFDASNHECNGLKIIKESGIKCAFNPKKTQTIYSYYRRYIKHRILREKS